MRQSYLIGWLIVCLCCVFLEAAGQSTVDANVTPELQLTTEVLESRFCESDYLRLQLRLRYVNSGDQPVILYRQSNTVMTYFISKTINDAEAKKYEQKYSPFQSPVGPFELIDSDRPDEQTFVILKPSAYYEVTAQAHLPFIFDGKDEDFDLLRPGRHVLQIRVQTWSAPQDLAIRLRERWRTHGYFWTRSIMSRPMTFSIPKNPPIVGCSPRVNG